ncbi:M16 family metallopeptidase [Saccharothrix luteola]|uniref:M16 family metallopeptidase n=1 Tax=Saccharothrix luteola TaxID=2893018 RepID=UPI001E3AAD0B|nr:pitrilysin family protein [Saccharothrix luteola]MCC8251532.1 insulinase family protein [Saccharothrix luteola]
MLPLVDARLRTTSFCLTVMCGSRSDPEGLGGLTHLLEHVVMSAPLTGGMSFSRRAEFRGGTVNAHTGLEEQQFYAQVHPDDADDVIELLLSTVSCPNLDDTVIANEKNAVLQELAGNAADPNEVVQDAILAALYPRHPLGAPVGGTAEGIRAASAQDLAAHHTTGFLTRPMSLTVVGPRPPQLDVAPQTRLRREYPVPLAPVTQPAVAWPSGYSWLCFGARSPGVGDPRRHAYSLLATLLGASPSSLMYTRLRDENGLGYAFEAWDRGYTEAGAWRLLVGVDDGNGDRVQAIVRDLLSDIAETGPSREHLLMVQRQTGMQLLIDSENPLELAKLTGVRTRGGVLGWTPEAELDALRAVSATDVAAAAADILANLITVVRPEG